LRVLGVCGGNALRITGIPEIFRELHFLGCKFGIGERWNNDDTHRIPLLDDGGEGHKFAQYLTGSRHVGENLAEVLKQRSAELPSSIQMCEA
jgi:hypothetical protein